MSETARVVGDASAIAITIGTIAQYLPPIAALFTIAWTGIQIYGWFEKRRARKAVGKSIYGPPSE